jgi:hypothetical protein
MTKHTIRFEVLDNVCVVWRETRRGGARVSEVVTITYGDTGPKVAVNVTEDDDD